MLNNNTPLNWTTITRKINDLIPQEVNPRKISDKQMSDLKRSLQKFNLAEIPAIDFDGKILAGHQRIKAMQLLGRGEEIIDVRIPNRKLTDEESKEYLIGSNKLGGEFDFELLKEFELETLEFAGFESIELSKEWDLLPNKKQKEFNVDKAIKEVKNPITKLGDRILLGDSVLLCGDSTDINVVKKLMNSKQADLCNTDIPYNIGLSYEKGVGGSKSNKSYGSDFDDNLSDTQYKTFIDKIVKNAISSCKEDAHYFIWNDERYVWLTQTVFMENGISNKRLLVWIKNGFSVTPTCAFNKVTEFLCYGTKGKPYLNDTINNLHEIINENIGTGNELLENINNLLLVKRLPSNEYSHPTQKSPELHHNILKRCSKIGDIVLDLTAGSGSILTACHELGRIAYMCELNPVFCDVIVKRYELLTGKKAIYENS